MPVTIFNGIGMALALFGTFSYMRAKQQVGIRAGVRVRSSPSPGPNPDQVNSSPSITADTPTDYELKFGLLDDVYTIIDVEGKLGGAVEPVVGGFDLVYNNGPVKPSP